MKEIRLSQGKIALVDDEDYERINKHKWAALKKPNTYYARRTLSGGFPEQRHIKMHREIMGLLSADGMVVDHINGNGLDNRKINLRVCTQFQNMRNVPKQPGKSSIYKGVYWRKERHKWQVRIKINGKRIRLGHFDDEIKAARIYDEAANKYFGEFARLNFSLKEDQ
jgi:hypothetical protein